MKLKNRLQILFKKLYMESYLLDFKQFEGKLWLHFYKFIFINFSMQNEAKVWGRPEILLYADGRFEVGKNAHWVSSSRRGSIAMYSKCHFTVYGNAELRLGNHVGLNGTSITCKKGITIGDDTIIAANTIIVDSDFHTKWPPEKRWDSDTEGQDEEVVIGKNVWIGMNCTILKGVSIGDNALIGAGSLVVDNIPANCLAVGNPAKVVKSYV